MNFDAREDLDRYESSGGSGYYANVSRENSAPAAAEGLAALVSQT